MTDPLWTYENQPMDNVIAHKLGRACDTAAKEYAGDWIDRGLSLLKALQAEGYGVTPIPNDHGGTS